SQLSFGEMHYFPTNISLRDGNLYLDLRRMAPQYCQRFWDSAGGVVGSAVELARVVAGSFQLGADSPVFDVATQSAMLTRRSILERGSASNLVQVTDSAWHWRDGGLGRTTYWHNGSQDGFYSFCWFRTDGVAIVLCTNSDVADYGTGLEAAADLVTTWPTDDLFPSYGMPSFPRRPNLTGAAVATLPNLTHQPFVLHGDNLDQVTQVVFGGSHVLVPALATAWANGYIRIISPTELHVFPPQGTVPGSYGVQAFSALGAGNTVNVSVTQTPTFTVAATDYVIGGAMPFSALASRGNLPGSTFVALGFSPSGLPSVMPGVVSLGIGNGFAELFTSDLRVFSPVTGVTRWDFPGIAGWSDLYLQAAALVPNSTNPFPLPTTGVVTVHRL
ncbi:MAG: hypothetical protein KDC98_12210, partial [Planctomycetes bacterium]|nr:hypothetical protein [Planctomycetota bacterium]